MRKGARVQKRAEERVVSTVERSGQYVNNLAFSVVVGSRVLALVPSSWRRRDRKRTLRREGAGLGPCLLCTTGEREGCTEMWLRCNDREKENRRDLRHNRNWLFVLFYTESQVAQADFKLIK